MNLYVPDLAAGNYQRQITKTLRIMKFTAIFLFAVCLSAGARSYSQTVTISEKNAPLTKIFKQIKKQTGYSFLVTESQLSSAERVTLTVKDVPLEQVLNICFSNQPFNYSIIEKTIVVKPREVIAPITTVARATVIDISGRITDADGKPLAGASIKIKGSNTGTTTDANGEFTLRSVDKNTVLIVSYVGYQSIQITPGDQQTINIKLQKADNGLDEVVVIGYGTQKKKDLTGAVATMSSKDLENRPNSQFGYAIEGKAAGVQIIRSSGQPQAGFSIRVRGTSSITSGSDPLYIVDGVPTENTNDINPADIESITVLKDASSAAIYGNKGANGVVLITTKRGKNQKVKIGFNTSLAISQPWKKMNVLNSSEFKDLATDMGATTDWNKYNANTNWQDEVFRNAVSQNYQLYAAGGTKKTGYYVSGSLLNQNGIVLNNNVKRGTLKANIDHQLTKLLKIGTSLAYDNWKDRNVEENQRNGVIARLYTTVPIIGIRDPSDPEMYARSPFINDLENPVSTVYQPDHIFSNNRYHGNVYAEAEIAKGLKLKSLFGFEKSEGLFTSFLDTLQTRYGKSQHGIAVKNKYDYKYWISENTVNYTRKIQNHSIAALGGFIVSRGTHDDLYRSATDFRSAPAGDNSVDAGAIKAIPSPNYLRESNASFIGRLNYNYHDKYFLTSNFRADGSGKFAEKNRWGYFPSFSAGWRLSQEDFFSKSNNPFISDLKIRAGWGIVGNDNIPAYSRYGLVDTISYKYLVGGGAQTAFVPQSLENSDLKWEKTSQFDIGIDLSLLRNRISLTADYYNKKTTDMLLAVPIPTSTGFSIAWQNAGSIENKGFEFTLSTKNIVSSTVKWNTDFNISFNRNKVLNIVGTTLAVGGINPAGDDFYTALVQEGKPLGSFYGKISQGVDPATGNIKFLQTKNNSSDSIGIIGNANPKFMYGLSNSISYGNFTLDIFFQGVYGNQILNATRILTESMSLVMNQSATVVDRWKNPGDVTTIPKVTPSDWSNSNPSTRYLESGSYLRLKSLTIGYNLPKTVISKMKMSRFMVYATGENLLTFTKYSGFDPEVSAFSARAQSKTNQNTAPGVDFGTYPQSRDFILGVNITF